MLTEPFAREYGCLLDRAWLFKEVCGVGNDRQSFATCHAGHSIAVQFENLVVRSTDNRKSRCADAFQRRAGKIGATSARDNGPNNIRARCCRDECSCSARACSEISDGQLTCRLI